MELVGPSAPVRSALAGWRTSERALHRIGTRRLALLDRMPMTARTAGALDDELDGPGAPRRCCTAGFALDGGLPTGTAVSSMNKS
jgi:hypothetical protein